MKRYNKNLGDFGESMAAEYLKDKGYEIIKRNYLVKGGEADVIAFKDNTLVFAEVKTRSSDKFGSPSQAVDKKKIAHMTVAAEEYYRQNPIDADIRFDVIEIYAKICGEEPYLMEINHIENIIIDQ